MQDTRTREYALRLARLIQTETISQEGNPNPEKFHRFQGVLRDMFPHIFAACEFENHSGSFLMRWKGSTQKEPILLMNHQDVVEAPGKWSHPPFAGEISEGRLWGRGTLDTKGGLWAMLQAADELAAEGFLPEKDIYFLSTCNEECGGSEADVISQMLHERGLHFGMVLDEGGMIVHEPLAGTQGAFAMVGVGEKGCADLKFLARSTGGHASTPGKNTPLVRLGKFMAAADKGRIFPSAISATVHEMFARLSSSMQGPLKFVLSHSRLLAPLLLRVMPMVSNAAGAMLKTTIAFTMADGSDGANVLPQEAWVIGNMRFSHHQGGKKSIEAITRLAKKYDIETEVLDPGFDSTLSDHKTEAFRLIERTVSAIFPGVITTPYVMTGASDCRYMSRICENCLRFAPFVIDNAQLESIHGIDENISLSTLAPAVDFYRRILKEA